MVSGRIALFAQQAFDQPQISVDGSRCVELMVTLFRTISTNSRSFV
jgi:hypothetical protein